MNRVTLFRGFDNIFVNEQMFDNESTSQIIIELKLIIYRMIIKQFQNSQYNHQSL